MAEINYITDIDRLACEMAGIMVENGRIETIEHTLRTKSQFSTADINQARAAAIRLLRAGANALEDWQFKGR